MRLALEATIGAGSGPFVRVRMASRESNRLVLAGIGGAVMWWDAGRTPMLAAVLDRPVLDVDGHAGDALIATNGAGIFACSLTGEICEIGRRSGSGQATAVALTTAPGVPAVAGFEDGSVEAWSPDYDRFRPLVVHRKAVSFLETASTGDVSAAISASDDRRVHMCNVRTGELLATFDGHVERISSLGVVSNPETAPHLVTRDRVAVRCWSLESGTPRWTVAMPPNVSLSRTWSAADGSIWFVAIGFNGDLVVWAEGTPVSSTPLGTENPLAIVGIDNPEPLVVAAFEHGVVAVDARSGSVVGTVGTTTPVEHLQPLGGMLAVIDHQGGMGHLEVR